MTFYLSTVPAKLYPKLDTTITCDVCIIGAGYAGLATAAGLVERGMNNIVILEAEQVGYGASGRNGGFVFGGFSLGNQALIDQLGQAQANNLYQLTLDAVELIRHRIEKYRIACDKNESGVLLANWFKDERILIRQQELMQRQFNVDWALWSREKTREHLRSNRYFAALHECNAFHFNPLKYAQGLATYLVSKGVQLFVQSKVLHIDSRNSEKIIRTALGEVCARHVVVCCGGYIENLKPALARSVLPITTFVMATEPLGEKLTQAINTPAAVYDTRFAFDYYRPLPDTRLLWGGRISIFNPSSQRIAKKLYSDMVKVYPQLHGVNVEYAWSGIMSYASHQMPQIGQLPDELWYAMGFGGHGVSTTTLAGEVVAEAITSNRTLPSGLEYFGLPPSFGAIGLLAAQCTYWFYELRDLWRGRTNVA